MPIIYCKNISDYRPLHPVDLLRHECVALWGYQVVNVALIFPAFCMLLK